MRPPWTATAVGLAAGGGLFSLGMLLYAKGPEAADHWSGVLSASVAVLVAAASVIGWLRRRDQSGEFQAGLLAARVTERCATEERQRRLLDPFPLPVSWHTLGPPVSDHWSVIRQGGGDGPLPLDGTLDDLHRVATTLVPSGRMVVLGAPGSGKTSLIIRFARACLSARAADASQPLPVILRLSTWDPAARPLRRWITEQVEQDYGVAGLAWDESILPVLDGLDEMPPAARGAALRAINTAFAPGVPLIVTSRTGEYHDAVRDADVLTGAAVIELDPLSPEVICAYLTGATRPDRVGEWEEVFDDVREEPGGPLGAALSVPLNLSLARLAYADGDHGRPGHLLGLLALRGHLLDRLIHVLYPEVPDGEHAWRRSDARRWLAFLARHLHRRDAYDLAWWELGKAVPLRARVVVWAVVAAIVFGAANTLAGLPWSLTGRFHMGEDLLWGLGVGLLAGAVSSLWAPLFPRVPKFHRFTVRRTGRALRWRLFGGLGAGLRRGLRSGVESGVPALAIVILLAGFVLDPPTAYDISGYLRHYAFVFVLGFMFGFCCGFVYGFIAGFGAEFVTVFDDLDAFNAGSGATPAETLRADRAWTAIVAAATVAITASVTVVFALTLFEGPHDAWTVTGQAIRFGLAGGLGPSLGTASSQFLLARLSLAASGRLPWRTMAFLQDAATRGALRQVGGTFQFRHALLRDRLVGAETPARSDRVAAQ
ncbi:NACHT domain-containing protein [Nonomuraea insulae]|uniref:NACHT domain-containing protein n=1 Tax=Nonomuraea insulae TaxID=1616787 RepID=A0ABW1CGX9_9ACTN